MSLIKIWKEKGKILEGIKNRIFKQEHIEEIANERRSICEKCPHIDKEGKLCAMKGTQPCCGKCGCSLSLKTRSLASGCGDEENPRWDPILDSVEEEMLEDIIDVNDKK